MLRILTVALAFASALAFGINGNMTRPPPKPWKAGTGYTVLAGQTIGGTANVFRGAKGYTHASCQQKCDESAGRQLSRCFSYVFNPKDGYCELWSRGYKSAGAARDIRTGCSSGCQKASRTGSSLYLKSAAWTPPPSQAPTTGKPTLRPTNRAARCIKIPGRTHPGYGDYCNLNGLCDYEWMGRDVRQGMATCALSQRRRDCCMWSSSAPTTTPTTTPKFGATIQNKECGASFRPSSTRYRSIASAEAGCMANKRCMGVYNVNCDARGYQLYQCGNMVYNATSLVKAVNGLSTSRHGCVILKPAASGHR